MRRPVRPSSGEVRGLRWPTFSPELVGSLITAQAAGTLTSRRLPPREHGDRGSPTTDLSEPRVSLSEAACRRQGPQDNPRQMTAATSRVNQLTAEAQLRRKHATQCNCSIVQTFEMHEECTWSSLAAATPAAQSGAGSPDWTRTNNPAITHRRCWTALVLDGTSRSGAC